MAEQPKIRVGVLTSGGDAPGMNAAVRAVARTALQAGLIPYAISEGYLGMVRGGSNIQMLEWGSVGGILHRGGTYIGTARCKEFTTREGRRTAAYNLLQVGIDRLVVIGGDGSLTGANIFRQEWPELLQELVAEEKITPEIAERHANLFIIGLVGSIDNDMVGTDITIGADTALRRIVDAIDAISSTAASHQRTFVVEVMGRHCGYLALMSALATGADWVLIPEDPPTGDWESDMCRTLHQGREMGRRDSIVVVAEGACDQAGQLITSTYIRRVLEERLGEDTRITILGHVQRGGSPTAFDRNISTIMGHQAVQELLHAKPEDPAWVIGFRANRLTRSPLMQCVQVTRSVSEVIKSGDYKKAKELRGRSFEEAYRVFKTMIQAFSP
jgi:6-phosphofructokinase 1